jgi:hypothetical protein
VLVIQGGIFVATVLLFRRGIVGEMAALGARFRRRGDKAASVAEKAAAHG